MKNPINRAFQVWHANDLMAASVQGRILGMSRQEFPNDYRLVARIDADSLDQAFARTNHVDGDWWENPGVKMVVNDARSTSEGDVIVDPHGTAYRVEAVGFAALGPETQKIDYPGCPRRGNRLLVPLPPLVGTV